MDHFNRTVTTRQHAQSAAVATLDRDNRRFIQVNLHDRTCVACGTRVAWLANRTELHADNGSQHGLRRILIIFDDIIP
jgi:hypothetical protein